jgi:hypothetical protein
MIYVLEFVQNKEGLIGFEILISSKAKFFFPYFYEYLLINSIFVIEPFSLNSELILAVLTSTYLWLIDIEKHHNRRSYH